MPYKILARNTKTGRTVTRMALDNFDPIWSLDEANKLAEEFAVSQNKFDRYKAWVPVVQEYTESNVNSNWDPVAGAPRR